MEWLILLVVLIWFILFIRKKRAFTFSLAPQVLDIKSIKGLKKLSVDLEQSLNKGYMENVADRVSRQNKLKGNEYGWRLLDLKRYFILTSLLKESPMFSEKVDELWHEMLMFTREYEDFSKNYLGTTLHHSPNVNVEPDPNLRGFFDWIYAELFYIRKENIHLYKGFFRFPVPPNIIDEFKDFPENELIDKYFKSDAKSMPVVLSLIASMKKTANRVKDHDKNAIRAMMKKGKSQQKYNAMLIPFLSVSYFHYDEFYNYMNESSNGSSSCTSCGSGSSCNSCSSGSSCSSCGGGGD